MFHIGVEDGVLSGLTLPTKKGAYAVVMFEKSSGNARKPFWQAVGKTLILD